MDKNFDSIIGLKSGQSLYSSSYSYDPEYLTMYDALWQLSLLGLDSGRAKIGKVEWFPSGADYLVSTQAADGSWGGVMGTSRAVMFLINGQRMEDSGVGGAGVARGTVSISPTTSAALTDDPARKAALRKVEAMKERLKAAPDSGAVAQELVRLYVVELQDPPSAAPYADKTGKADTAELLALAAVGASELADTQCLRLADWYMGMVAGSSPTGRKSAYTRAETYYKRFLQLHEAGDAARLKAKIGLQKAQEGLAEFRKE
jgi:hypothetical protein